MVMTRAGTPTNPSASVMNSPRATHQQKRQRRTRTRLRLSNDTGGTDEVEVSSSVAVRTAAADDPDDAPDVNDSSDSFDDESNWVHEHGDGRDARGGQREERDDAGRDGNAGGRYDRDDDDNQSRRALHDEKDSPPAAGSKHSGWDRHAGTAARGGSDAQQQGEEAWHRGLHGSAG
ncbi:unnamed protein product [Phytophthora fragariaefolia]|uniref:Unnamed protein product n=1 Tax=Phytophthora fragariaefolia TaxID=1490495 RepID=A0A9W6Y188_9STRA|nr:unnamed protein product [Phytophthora fragariaefolia]